MQIIDTTFVHWATERELSRQRREAGILPPWTNDPIVRDYRFCNVSREDDRVTRWIKANIRDPFDGGESDNLFKALCLARFINLPETLGELLAAGLLSAGGKGEAINWEALAEAVRRRQERGEKSFSAAYMVRSETNKASACYGVGKIAYICSIVSGAKLPTAKTREGFVQELSAQYGFGTFMAGQVAADAAYTHLLADAPDHLTWAPLGPGAMRGMNRALGRPINASISQEEYLKVGRLQMEMLPPSIVLDRKLTLHDVASNVNCETDKYLRIKNNQGTTRRFTPC